MIRDLVLVIDDDPDFRELVAVLVETWGLQALEAQDCASALALIERERARLRTVLLDYFMPGLDPLTCTKEILERLDPEVPVVLVSAAVDIRERAAAVGLHRFLAKPFEVSELRTVALGNH